MCLSPTQHLLSQVLPLPGVQVTKAAASTQSVLGVLVPQLPLQLLSLLSREHLQLVILHEGQSG